MKLVYHLTDAARQRIFVETGRDPGQPQAIEVDPAQLSREDRATLLAVDASFGQQINLSYTDVGSAWGSTRVFFTRDGIADDAVGLLAAFRVARADAAARIVSADEAQIGKEIAALLDWDQGRAPSTLNLSMHAQSPRRQEWIAAHATATATAQRIGREFAEARAREADALALAQATRAATQRAWIEAHGSAYLKKCLSGGYDCTRRYVIERAAVEHPGYVVDYNDVASWKDRAGPSERAMDEAANVGGLVVWLTHEPSNAVAESEDWEDSFEQGEAIVIREYLDKYDLIKML